jgi:Flp pilus assembly protein TadD
MRSALLLMLVCLCLQGCASSAARRGAREPVQQLTAQQNLEIAALLEQRGDSVRAQQYLCAALANGADPEKVFPRLLRLYVADGQYRLAAAQTENYLRRHPSDRKLHLLLATLYMALGYHGQAVEQYEKVLTLAPSDAQAHFALATALHDGGVELARADTHYRAYLKIEPEGPYAEEARSLLLTEMP